MTARRHHLVTVLVLTLPWLAGAEALTTADGGMPFRLGWRKVEIGPAPAETGLREPELISRKPLYLGVELGSGPDRMVSGILDESRGDGTGYDTVRLDANNNNDLTDDPVLRPGILREGPITALELEPIAVTVRYAGGTSRVMKVKLELRGSPASDGSGLDWSVGYHLDQHLEGLLDLGGGRTVRIAIFDSAHRDRPSNGCFSDWGVDRIRVDLDGDEALHATGEESPLSRVLRVHGALWTLALDDAGMKAEVKPFVGDTGFLAFDVHSTGVVGGVKGRLDVVSDAGFGFGIPLGGDGVFQVPVATYRLARGQLSARDRDGREWTALLSLDKALDVGKGVTNRLTLGAPLSLGIATQGRAQRGKDLCIEPVIRGAAGEGYENVAVAGSRMTPQTRILGSEDIVVAQGPMNYG